MKKALAIILALCLGVCVFAGCGNEKTEFSPNEKSEGSLTYAEFAAKADGETVTVEGYLQAKGDTYSAYGTSNLYLADGDGAYFVYRLAINSQEDWDKMTVGTKIKITGVKGSWAGEVEVLANDELTPGTYEIIDGSKYVAEAKDITDVIASDTLHDYNNQMVTVKNAVVVDNGNGQAFSYNKDIQGEDIYFKVKVGETVLTFCVETDYSNSESAAYKAAEALQIGDTVTISGFAYWYDALQLHVTNIIK